MALESLNRYIKREKLKDNGNIRLEKLLNVLEEVVDDKMWKRIITLKRPNRNSYQGRAVVLAHKKAETMKNYIQEEGYGHFNVKSSKNDKYYNVLYKEPCMYTNCREMFCEACKVCFHKYKCECVEYSVKNTTCKHVHVVAMYERERQQFLTATETEEVPSIIPQIINDQVSVNDEEISDFLGEKSSAVNCIRGINMEEKRSLVMEQALNYLNQMSNLDNNSFAGMSL